MLSGMKQQADGLVIGASERGEDGPDAIGPGEAAALLGLSLPAVMRLAERGLLGAGGSLSRAEVLAFRAAQSRRQREALAGLADFAEEHDF